MVILGKQLENCRVRSIDVFLVARERNPPERSLAFAKKWPDVGGNKTGEFKCVSEATFSGFVANRVAVVEDFGTLLDRKSVV